MEDKLKVCYCLLRRWTHNPIFGKIPTYTILGVDGLGDRQRFSYPLYDRVFALLLVRTLNRNNVSLLHTEDVLHDLLLETYTP